MSNIGGAVKVFSACQNLADAAKTANAIYGTITGTTGTDLIVDVLNQLDLDIQKGFQNVVRSNRRTVAEN